MSQTLAGSQTLADRIAGWLDQHSGPQADFLSELVKVPSDNPPGDTDAHAARAGQLLEGLGFTVERHKVPEDKTRAAGMISATNLVIRRHYGPGPVVALNAHGDVVPPGQGWSHDPHGGQVHEGALHGRGAAVSKSDFATYAFAILALEAAGAPLTGGIELHLTHDEESGGFIGPRWLLAEGISRPDLAICAGFAHGIVTAHNGCLHLEVTLQGRQAHAALPETGIDALEAANGVLSALYAWRKGLAGTSSAVPGIGSPSLVVGLIKGGINTNVVPDLVTLRLDRRLIPEESGIAAEAELKAVIEGAAAQWPGITCRVTRVMLAEPLTPLPGADRLIAPLARHAGRIFGADIKPHGVPLYTDARHYQAAGIPVVLYGAGPRTILEANAHGADEHLRLSDLRRATEVVALTLADILC